MEGSGHQYRTRRSIRIGGRNGSCPQPNGSLRGQKAEAFEGGQRVPMLARWPGRIPAGTRSDALVALTDTLATFADLLGKDLPDGTGPDSFGYLGALLDQEPTKQVRSSLVHNSYHGGFGIRLGIWNLLMFQTGGGRDWNPQKINREELVGQLYNLAEDLGEQNNLYIANPEIVEKLQKMLRKIKANGYSN